MFFSLSSTSYLNILKRNLSFIIITIIITVVVFVLVVMKVFVLGVGVVFISFLVLAIG